MGMAMVLNVHVVALSVTSILLVGILASPVAAAAAAAEEREMVKYSSCNGTIAECFGNELEMVMDSDTSRRFLQGGKGPVTSRTVNPSKSIGPKCGRRYTGTPCIPPPNPKKPFHPCNEYDRCKTDIHG